MVHLQSILINSVLFSFLAETSGSFDYIIINDNVETAYAELRKAIVEVQIIILLRTFKLVRVYLNFKYLTQMSIHSFVHTSICSFFICPFNYSSITYLLSTIGD